MKKEVIDKVFDNLNKLSPEELRKRLNEANEHPLTKLIMNAGVQMTTPRVYTAPCLFYRGKLTEDEKVIILSDHKEVVKGLEAKLETAVMRIDSMEILGSDAAFRAVAAEALVKRQALAIEKLKEQRNEWAKGHDVTPTEHRRNMSIDDLEIEAILNGESND